MFIPLSKLCIGGITATPDFYGDWCWTVEGTQWKFSPRNANIISVYRQNQWQNVGKGETLNYAVAFSLGWQALLDTLLYD